MAITRCAPMAAGCSGSCGSGVQVTDLWEVVSDTVLPSFAQVLRDATSLPRRGDRHPDNAYLRVDSVQSADQVSAKIWRVAVVYASQHNGTNAGQGGPLAEPWDIEFDWETSTEPVEYDADGAAIANSLGERFDPAPTREFHDRVVVCTHNESREPSAAYHDVLNYDVIAGCPQATLKLKSTGRLMRSGTLALYYRNVYRVAYRPDTWLRRFRDQGFRGYRTVGSTIAGANPGEPNVQTAGVTKRLQTFCDEFGQPLTQPSLLNGKGEYAKANDFQSASRPVFYYEHRLTRWASFGALGLPLRSTMFQHVESPARKFLRILTRNPQTQLTSGGGD